MQNAFTETYEEVKSIKEISINQISNFACTCHKTKYKLM